MEKKGGLGYGFIWRKGGRGKEERGAFFGKAKKGKGKEALSVKEY
jgi:hypothetical protein